MLTKKLTIILLSFVVGANFASPQDPKQENGRIPKQVKRIPHSLSSGSDCSSGWKVYSHLPNNEGALPESNVTYFRYQFRIQPGKKIKFKIEGEFPRGRYFGFNVYDAKKMDSNSGIADYQIEADPKSTNPFTQSGEEGDRFYSISVVPFGQSKGKSNTLEMKQGDSNQEQLVEIWYRIYDPVDGPGNKGQKPLPKITATDSETGILTDCPEITEREVPKTRAGGISANLQKIKQIPPARDEKGKIHFVYHKGMGLYANHDTHYMTARLPLTTQNENIAVIRLKVPKVNLDFPEVSKSDSEVRYWSFCTGSAVSTITTDCIADRDAQKFVDKDGFLTVVVGPSETREKVKNAAFLESKDSGYPVIIYRHLLPKENFTGNFTKLPVWPVKEGKSIEDYYADNPKNGLGEYAPVVSLFKAEDFKSL